MSVATSPDVPVDLDVRSLPPAQRHTVIFDVLGKLKPGKGFILVNDHDPKPLYYQMEAEHPGAYSWEYLERGPAVWRVKVAKKSSPGGLSPT